MFTMAKTMSISTLFVIGDTVKSKQPTHHKSSPELCHQHRQLQSFTVIECFFKFVNGKVFIVISHQNHGVGKKETLDSPPAPDDLLKIIRCNCLTNCQNARCSCVKHGLKCSAACGNCHGTACSNASSYVMNEGSGDEDS